jgi:hypothetical protein
MVDVPPRRHLEPEHRQRAGGKTVVLEDRPASPGTRIITVGLNVGTRQ